MLHRGTGLPPGKQSHWPQILGEGVTRPAFAAVYALAPWDVVQTQIMAVATFPIIKPLGARSRMLPRPNPSDGAGKSEGRQESTYPVDLSLRRATNSYPTSRRASDRPSEVENKEAISIRHEANHLTGGIGALSLLSQHYPLDDVIEGFPTATYPASVPLKL